MIRAIQIDVFTFFEFNCKLRSAFRNKHILVLAEELGKTALTTIPPISKSSSKL